jgi:hypothetical protein
LGEKEKEIEKGEENGFPPAIITLFLFFFFLEGERKREREKGEENEQQS